MQDILGEALKKIKIRNIRKKRMIAILLVLSLLVSLDVFWTLRQPGLTLAGNADCGVTEHTHDAQCQNGDTGCSLQEHVHTLECYADETADVETQLDWQEMFEMYPYTGNLGEDVAGIAQTQVGYEESRLNFKLDEDGTRHGYTRYGAWYGTPYSNWSATFVSFCLHYAGADPKEFPTNTGANSMAAQWKALGKYVSAGNYTPIKGDLVFFKDNTVGIVFYSHPSSCYVIRGDVDGRVCNELVQLNDPSIEGWGLISRRLSVDDMLDISQGPAFFVFDNGIAATDRKMQTYSLRKTRTAVDLIDYLDNNQGSFYILLLDLYNHEVPKDENENFVVHANTKYKITFTANSPYGFSPGTYQYRLPDGIEVDGGKGEFVLTDKTNVGSWEVTDDGLIVLEFNQNINNRTDVILSSTMGIYFPLQEDAIDFDGKISVVVEKPREEIVVTEVRKWGVQGNPDNVNDPTKADKTDESKLYWTVLIEGNQNSNIPGSVITDKIMKYDWSYQHYYSEADITAGLRIGASVVNPDKAEENFWHRWTVLPDDPNLTWDENGWTYTIPETIWCELGHEAVLGNDNWTYYIEYTSTPEHTNIAGELGYVNKVEVDQQTQEGWGGFMHTEVQADIFKNGTLVTDATGAKIFWEVQATIPRKQPGLKADSYWNVTDSIAVVDAAGNPIDYIENDIKLGKVTANYHDATINVPYIYHATENDPYALVLYDPWYAGYYDVRQFMILRRCECTEESCPKWQGGCYGWGYADEHGQWHQTSDYCDCWLDEEDTTFTFTYETDAVEVLTKYQNRGYSIHNKAALANAVSYTEANAKVLLPGIIEKEVTAIDDYIIKYEISVNESKLTLTDGSPLVIHDMMTDTLAYVGGSLVVRSVDGTGNENTLQQGMDYTVTYDGTGNQTGENGKKAHVLDVVILHPQPVTYFLNYDTMLLLPDKVTEGVKYSNYATVTLWGKPMTDATAEKVFADINIAAKSYRVDMFKTAADTKQPLAGAIFGLYNENGGLITSATTDVNGQLIFQTDIVQGVILQEHLLYYMQELRAPPGYKLDDTKYWFCFCDETGDSCEVCEQILDGLTALRISSEQIGTIYVTNELMQYQLPATGGPGIYLLILVGAILTITPLVYISIRRRKRERRGVG